MLDIFRSLFTMINDFYGLLTNFVSDIFVFYKDEKTPPTHYIVY